MKAKHILIPSIAIVLAFVAIRFHRTTARHPAIDCNDSGNGESTNIAPSCNMPTFSAIHDHQIGQSRHGNARQKAVQAHPVEKDGQFSVYFDYDRGLEPVAKPWPLSPEMARAETQGAPFKFSFLIVDENDAPVEGAKVAIVALNRQGSEVFSSHTDADGVASVEGFGTGEIHVEIDKSGYFHMSLWHWIFKPHLKCVSDGRWLPWNPTIEVQLTSVPSTCSAVELKANFRSREGAGLYGFDLISVVPSTSTNCDMLITVTEIPPDAERKYPTHNYDVFFPGKGNGAQIVKKNLFCACPYPPIAPENGYTNRLEFSGWNPIAEDETVVFRIRNSDAEEPLYGIFRHPFLPNGTGLSFWFDVVVNVERGLRTLVPAVETAPPTKFFELWPLDGR